MEYFIFWDLRNLYSNTGNPHLLLPYLIKKYIYYLKMEKTVVIEKTFEFERIFSFTILDRWTIKKPGTI